MTLPSSQSPSRKPGLGALGPAAEALPFGVAVIDHDGVVTESTRAFAALCGLDAANRPLRALLELSEPGDLASPLTDAPVTLASGAKAWITVRSLEDVGHVVCLRPADPPAGPAIAPSPRPLRVRALGRCEIETHEGRDLNGPWLEQRAGQLLRLLVAARGRVLTIDQIADALWPDADAGSAATVRYVVHTLRDRLEPDRPGGAKPAFVVSHRGGYRLDMDRVTVDADVFERELRDGLAAHAADGSPLARRLLERAVARYRGDFLPEEPYADWAAPERERLRELLGRALRALAELAAADGDLDTAGDRLAQLAELEPLDIEVHRDLIALCQRRGRHGEAARRYAALRRRTEAAFGDGPGFALSPG